MTSTDTRPEPRLTLLTSAQEGVDFVGKRFTLQDDGTVAKTAAGNIWRWHAEVRLTPSAEGLARGLSALRPDQAIALGAPAIEPDSPFLIGHGIRRTQEHFRHAEGRGWLLLDYDNAGMPAAVAQRIRELGGVVPALERVWPELRTAERLVRFSSSAGVHRVGDPAPDLSDDVALGRHVFVLMRDQRQSKAALEALTLRAFAHGLGWVKLSASGGLLVRSIVDASVYGPERLVFCGPPSLGSGLSRTVPPIEWQSGNALDAPLPPPGSFAHQEIARLKADAAPEARQVQRAHRKVQTRRIMAQTGATARQAIAAVRQRLDGGVLSDGDLLERRDGSRVVVAALLDEVEARHAAGENVSIGMPCPAEGVEYGSTSATLLWSKDHASPVLVSHAHGGRAIYRFERYVSPALKARPVDLPALPTAEDARAALGAAMSAFMARAEGWAALGQNVALAGAQRPAGERPFELFNIGAGLGKTASAIRESAELVARLNQADAALCEATGEDQHPHGRYAVVFAAPTHKLLDQIGRDFDALGLDGVKVVHLRGPKAEDPNAEQVPGGEPIAMCRESEHFTTAQAFLQDARRVCRGCDYRDGCSYLENQRGAGTVYLITHAEIALGRTAPPVLARRGQILAALIVDEDPSSSLVRTTDGAKIAAAGSEDASEGMTLRLKKLAQAPITGDAPGSGANAAAASLLRAFAGRGGEGLKLNDQSRPVVVRVREALAEAAGRSFGEHCRGKDGERDGPAFMDLGHLSRAMRARGLMPSDLTLARLDEWGRRLECDDVRLTVKEYVERVGANLSIRPAQAAYATLAEALEAAGWDDFAVMATWGKAERDAPAQGLCGRVQVADYGDEDGVVLSISGVAAMGDGYASAPTLLLDATADADLVQRVWGQAPTVTTIKAIEPDLVVTQDATMTGSKRQMAGSIGSKADRAAAKNWQAKLARWLRRVVEEHPDGVLLCCNLEVERALREAAAGQDLPFSVAHFNDLRGRNDFQHATCVVVVGRTQPSSDAVAATMEALTGSVVPGRDDLIKQGPVERLAALREGHALVEGTGAVSADPLAAALVRQVTAAEVEQAIGRLRAVNRPGVALAAFVLSDVVLDRPVTLASDIWDQIKAAGVVQAQLDAGDIAFLSSAHAYRAYRRAELRPGVPLWKSVRAAEKAFERDERRRELLEAIGVVERATTRHSSLESLQTEISPNPLLREMSGSGDDELVAGIEPRRFHLARYHAPRSPKASYALIRAAALGDGPLSNAEAIVPAIAGTIRAVCGFEPRDLMLHTAWGPQPDDAPSADAAIADDAPSAVTPSKRLIAASPSGLLADLPPVKAPPAAASLSWRCLETCIVALRLHRPAHDADSRAATRAGTAGGVAALEALFAAAARPQPRGPRAA